MKHAIDTATFVELLVEARKPLPVAGLPLEEQTYAYARALGYLRGLVENAALHAERIEDEPKPGPAEDSADLF